MNQLIDSNVIIYSAKPEFSYLRGLILPGENFVSALSKIEVLGYHLLIEEDKKYFDAYFELLSVLAIDDSVIDLATELRRMFRMKTSDAIIAATAQIYQLELVTRNVDDFSKISSLKIFDPIRSAP